MSGQRLKTGEGSGGDVGRGVQKDMVVGDAMGLSDEGQKKD